MTLIEWEDAFNGNHSWHVVADIPKRVTPLVLTTVGCEVRRSKKRVTLAMSYGESRTDPTCCDLFTIPIGMIRSERTLGWTTWPQWCGSTTEKSDGKEDRTSPVSSG